MHNDLLAGLAIVGVTGIASQWVAWRLRFPSILLLLVVGILMGPVTNTLDVDGLLGDLLFPVVSLSVAVILFEGGLSLRLSDLREVRSVVRNLIVIGVPLTWVISSIAAYFLLGFDVELSLLVGAILVVTGPTVIIPLLQQIRPVKRVSSILRWEGITIDPVGAVLAVLVFEEILATGGGGGLTHVLINLTRTIIIGGAVGWFSAFLMIALYSRYWVPFSLQNPVTLSLVLGAFTASNLLQAEAGLVTVTVMGFVMANQNRVDLRHIMEFKESLQVILISALFIILSARLELTDITDLGWNTVAFVAMIILVERPLSVWISAYGSDLTWREKLFVAAMAPRGIVAASVASIFALELAEAGIEGTERIVPVTFATIIGTVVFYSFASGWIARQLGLTQRQPQGVLMLGSQYWARRIAQEIQALGFRIIVTDSNQRNIERAESMGLETYLGNVLSESIKEEVDFNGIGRLLAMTSNDEVNALATLHFRGVFGQREVYQLPGDMGGSESVEDMSNALVGRRLFQEGVTFNQLGNLFRHGATIETIVVEDVAVFEEQLNNGLLPLFVATEDGYLYIYSADEAPRIQPGNKVIALRHQSP